MVEDTVSAAPSTAAPPAAAAAAVGNSVIPIMNKLQDIFSKLGTAFTVDLPQVAVVGCQSSGKSSVLEALVGRDFLPRGSDICTRRPLVLQLVHCPRRPERAEGDEWGEFLHLPGKRYYDFSDIRWEIQLDIMDRGTNACNFLLGNVIPLKLGYVGVVNRSQQILVRHIKAVLPGLKARINTLLVAVAKEHAAYRDIVESKAGQGVKLLNILTKFCQAFSSLLEGKNEGMSTNELSGGARICYIFQSIFVKNLEMDYINTSHPNFIGGNRAEKIAQQQVMCSRILAAVPKFKGVQRTTDSERSGSAGSMTGRSWGISSIFGSSENHASTRESSTHKSYSDPAHNMDHSFSMIQLREPPIILRPSENLTEQEAVEIATSYLLMCNRDISGFKWSDFSIQGRPLRRLLREPADMVAKRKRIRETLRVLQQAYRTLEELPLDPEAAEKGFSLDTDPTGLPKIHGLPPSFHATSNDLSMSCTASPRKPKSRKVHSAEQPSTLHSYSDANLDWGLVLRLTHDT
ncbi:hypothetical protein COCNU_15G004760 [Cocos nucifera]|uniref:Dynamin-type G domain-containing protein n=1 Tax=Cocos nucifera TaxID=13894 RepID=A0A8K0IX59_COCNU|nr:hypothetical protein COCNU_15G004760 [Cocos nucifera]